MQEDEDEDEGEEWKHPSKRSAKPNPKYQGNTPTSAESLQPGRSKMMKTMKVSQQRALMEKIQMQKKDLPQPHKDIREDISELQEFVVEKMGNMEESLRVIQQSIEELKNMVKAPGQYPVPSDNAANTSVEIYPGSEVFVSRSAWRAASYANTSTAMVRCLFCSVFDMETLLRSNLRGGKSKTACGEEARDGLDSGKVKAIMKEEVDEDSFMLLDDASIAALIPRIGLRVKFKKFHSEFLGDIREILRKSGGATLITSLDRDRLLSLKERRQMVRLLVSHLMESFGETPSAEIKKEMALALTAQFPCLKNNEGHGYESWYTPGRYRHPATGYLEERLRNVRKRLRAPHSQRQHSHPQPSQNSSSRPSFPLPESESSLTELHTMIEWLKNNRSPHSQVEELMIRTAPHRAAWIRSSGTKTVEEINREYPRLYDFPGMISQDFGDLFPDNADRLYEFWAPVFTDRILLFARKEPKAADVLLESLETLSNDVRGEVAFKTLPAVLPSSPYRTDGKMVRPTYAEIKRSFIDIKPPGSLLKTAIMGKTADHNAIIDTLKQVGKRQKEISERIGCSQSAVSRHLSGKSVGRKKCGKKRCTTRRGDRTMRKIVEKDRFQTLGDLRKQWTESGVETSRATVHRRVQEMGYRCRIPQVKPLLNQKQRQKRLTWATEKQHWTVAQWLLKFCMSFGNQGARVWRKTGEKEMPKCLKSSVKYPQSVMVWGAMSAAGVGPLCFIKGRVNAASYQEILEHSMLPSAEKLYGDEDFILQHDLAPAHSAKTTGKWFTDHGITVLNWPANSSDLNPIENLWDIVKRKLRDARPNTLDELKAAIQASWASITPQQCHRLIASMPRRIEAVISAKRIPDQVLSA
ncbi:unnamed protein product [Leuciscus chuanchicus]